MLCWKVNDYCLNHNPRCVKFRLFSPSYPPLCINTSVDFFIFDYIIALYPIFITILMYIQIELNDRNCKIVVILSLPLRLLHNHFRGKLNGIPSTLSSVHLPLSYFYHILSYCLLECVHDHVENVPSSKSTT